jgi:ribosomal-protein-alanine N-acetyltransferase
VVGWPTPLPSCPNLHNREKLIVITWPERIETERLELRSTQMSDAEEMFARYASKPEVVRFLLWLPHKSVDETREWIRGRIADRDAGRRFNWLMRLRGSEQILGSIGCGVEKHIVEFGYYLGPESWNRGFATEAAQALVRMWLATPGIWRVQAYCDLENVASARVLEKAGLVREGVVRRHTVAPNLGPEPRDSYLYARVREA